MEDTKPKSLVLLRIDHPCYLVMRNDYRDASEQDSLQFFYEEHSCPTNWLGTAVEVIQDGQPDAHGFAEFVRAVDAPDDFDEDDVDWRALFPEAFRQPPEVS